MAKWRKKKPVRNGVPSHRSSVKSSIGADPGARPPKRRRPVVRRPAPRPAKPPVPKPRPPRAVPRRPGRRPPRVAGLGIAAPSMFRPSNFDEVQMQRLERLYSRWEHVAEALALTDVADRLEDVDSVIADLPTAIGRLRERGYRFHPDWEQKADALLQQWESRRDLVYRQFETQSLRLQQEAQQVSRLLDEAARNASRLPVAESRLDALSRLADEAKASIFGAYDQVEASLRQLRHEMSEAEFLLEMLGSASFPLLPEEHGIAAVRADWLVQGGEPMKGVLILTDSRLLFEQREEVVKKKVLFFATEKETIQKLQWQAPIGAVQIVGVEDKGGFLKRHRELLTLRMEGGEAPPQVTVELHGATNEDWAALIRHAQADELRMVGAETPPVQAEAQAQGGEAEAEARHESTSEPAPPAELPTVCPQCGAPLPTIYKGMKQVTCEYCGTVVRL